MMTLGEDSTDSTPNLADEAGAYRKPLMTYFARRVSDKTEVEDLVQEVFTRIVARSSVEPVGHIAGYVFQTAASVLADRGRRRAVRHADAHIAFDADQHDQLDTDAVRAFEARQDLRQVTAALLQLPERTRSIFILHRLEGRRYREIGEQLGISVSAVEKHMARAVHRLSTCLEDRP
jgi:RNA polymerase sigma-70 factor (ECF subfamily)